MARKAKFERGKIIKKFNGTGNIGQSCYFHVAIRMFLSHPCLFDALNKIFVSNKHNIDKDKDSKDWSTFFRYLHILGKNGEKIKEKNEKNSSKENKKIEKENKIIEEENKKIFNFLYTFYVKDCLGGVKHPSDTGEALSNIIEKFNNTFNEEYNVYSFIENDNFCDFYGKTADDCVISTKQIRPCKDVFLQTVYPDVTIGDNEYDVWSLYGMDKYEVKIIKRHYNDVFIIGSAITAGLKVKKPNNSIVEQKRKDLKLEDIHNIKIGEEEYVLTCFGLHPTGHWVMVGCEDLNDLTVFNDDKAEKKSINEINEYIKNEKYMLQSLMYIKKSSLENGKASYEPDDNVLKDISSELNNNDKEYLLDNVKKIEREKIIAIRTLIQNLIKSGFSTKEVAINYGVSKFFLEDSGEPIVSCEKDFQTDQQNNFSAIERNKLLKASEFAINIINNPSIISEPRDRSKLSDRIKTIFNEGFDCSKINLSGMVKKYIKDPLKESLEMLKKYLSKEVEKKLKEKDGEEEVEESKTENNVKSEDKVVTETPPIKDEPVITKSSDVENIIPSGQIFVNKEKPQQFKQQFVRQKNINKKTPIFTDSKKLPNNESKEEKYEENENNEFKKVDINDLDKIINIPPRPVIEFWVYLLCLILIGFIILSKKKEQQKKWDNEYKNSNNKLHNLVDSYGETTHL